MAVDKSMNVLVVDDYKTMVRIVRTLMQQLGFTNIDDATDGPTLVCGDTAPSPSSRLNGPALMGEGLDQSAADALLVAAAGNPVKARARP